MIAYLITLLYMKCAFGGWTCVVYEQFEAGEVKS